MKVHSCLLSKAKVMSFIKGFLVKRRHHQEAKAPHFVFTYDMAIFYGARIDNFRHLNKPPRWFEPCSRLRINLEKK